MCPRSGERPRTDARAGGPAAMEGQWHGPGSCGLAPWEQAFDPPGGRQ